MPVPLVIAERGVAANLNFEIEKPVQDGRLEPDIPHEAQRTALELLIATEIQRRFGLFVAQIVGEFGERGIQTVSLLERDLGSTEQVSYDEDAGVVMVDRQYLRRLFDLSRSLDISRDRRTDFQVLEISLESPLTVWGRIRRILAGGTLMINISTATGASVAVDLGQTITTAAGFATAAGVGYTIHRSRQDDVERRNILIDATRDTLASELGKHHPDFRKLQTCLEKVLDPNGRRYYSGPVDGMWGPHLREAIRQFIDDKRLPEGTHYTNPDFIDAVSKAAAAAVLGPA
jgi:hypothetical protein